MTYFALVKKGYGSINQIKQLDTDELMNIINYENMMNDAQTGNITGRCLSPQGCFSGSSIIKAA